MDVWVPDKQEAFVLGHVVSRTEKQVVVTVDGMEKTVKSKDAMEVNPSSQDGVADNTELMYLNDAALLHNLKVRYMDDQIYTYTGNILTALNPFQRLPIYGEEEIFKYVGKSIGVMPPHVYAITDFALRSMKTSGVGQSIIISGESGAGKTETAKVALEYLTGLCGDDQDGTESLAQKLLQSNPILEAFGNAKTTRNNNSSRFGKFMEIEFDDTHMICGGKVETYLLEKTRIVQHQQNERSYHSFYQLCAGAPDDLRNALKLGPPESFHYTNQSDTTTIDGVDDAADYLELTEAMDHCGFSTEEVHTVFQLLAGILHLGNVAYEPDSQDNASLPAASKAVAEDTAHYLGVDVTTLQKNLVTTEVKTRGETFNKPLSVPNAGYVRDALAKAVYGRVFDWLVLRIDDAFAGDCEPRSFIGVLDIYGFEFFELNSFEQLCINFANEKLQMHFNQSVFNQEKAMYAAEAITVPEVAYRDNAGVIDAIEAKGTGILDLLDQTCKMPRATDQAFCEAVQDRHQRSKVISPPRMSSRGKKGAPKQRNFRPDEAFVVKHFAGDVTYCVDGFLAKNMDPLNDGLLGMLVSSSVELVAALFAPTAEEGAAPKPGSRKKKKATVSTKFKKQLNLLTESLASTTSHFIRCVKPNVQKKPKVFEGPKVMDQLRCSGMIEALELMHEGFPTRCHFSDLYDRYAKLMPPEVASMQPGCFVQFLLTALGMSRDSFRIGLTRVFFRAGQYAMVDELTSNEELLPMIASKVKQWLVAKTLKKAVFTVASVKLMQRRLDQLRARGMLESTARVGQRIVHGGRAAQMRAQGHLHNQRQLRYAGGVMHAASRTVVPAAARARAAILEREAEEERERVEAEAQQRAAMIAAENERERLGREEKERKQQEKAQKERDAELARNQAEAARAAEIERRERAVQHVHFTAQTAHILHQAGKRAAEHHRHAIEVAVEREKAAKAMDAIEDHEEHHEHLDQQLQEVATQIVQETQTLEAQTTATTTRRERTTTEILGKVPHPAAAASSAQAGGGGMATVAEEAVEEEEEEEEEEEQEQEGSSPTIVGVAKAKFDFRPSAEIVQKFKGAMVLTLQAGTTIEITDDAGDWWTGRVEGTQECGFFPSNYVKRLRDDAAPAQAPDNTTFAAWKASKMHLVEVMYEFVPSTEMVEEWKRKHKGTSVLTLAVGDLVEVTDFGTDWWTGIKQTRRSETTASAADHHGGRKQLVTQSFDYGVFPANHVQTIPISPLDVKAKLKKGTTLVVQNSSNMWRRVRVAEGPGIMSKQVKIHFIGYLEKWDEYIHPHSKRIAGVTPDVESPYNSEDSDYSSYSSDGE